MRTAGTVLVLLACIGVVHAITYTSLDEAVKHTTELSMLTERIDAFPTFANQVMAPSFVGTLFAPMDSALKPIEKFASMMLSNPSTATDMLALFVVPGKPLTLADLKDGMKLTTLNNQQVTVSIKTAADGKPIYYINQARIASGDIYAGQSIIHQMAGVIVAPSKQLLLNAALKTSGWSDSNPPATVNLSPNGPQQEVVQEPAAEEPTAEEPEAEEPVAEQPAPTTGADTQAPADTDVTHDDKPSDSDITYEQDPQAGDDITYENDGITETEPSQEAPVPTVPATDDEPMPAPPTTPAPTTTAPAQPQQPSVPVTVVPAPSTPQQQPEPNISLEQGKSNTTTPTAPTTTTGTTKPPAATAPAAIPAPVTARPAATVATPAATTTTATTPTSTGLPPAKTTSASSSVVVSAVAAVVPVVMALMMLA